MPPSESSIAYSEILRPNSMLFALVILAAASHERVGCSRQLDP